MNTAAHRLNPHHVILLSCYIIKGDGGEDYIRGTINDFKEYPQYEPLAVSRHIEEGVPLKYGDAFIENIIEYCKNLTKDPNNEIEVVDGIDSFCSLQCSRYSKSCETSSEESKAYLMDSFGLNIGDVFTIENISQIFQTNRGIRNQSKCLHRTPFITFTFISFREERFMWNALIFNNLIFCYGKSHSEKRQVHRREILF